MPCCSQTLPQYCSYTTSKRIAWKTLDKEKKSSKELHFCNSKPQMKRLMSCITNRSKNQIYFSKSAA
uniref:Uncharacterized protein n=1 Tax=Arundo donax TaxID=35708 RepID=A0A0A9DY43_ARUDO